MECPLTANVLKFESVVSDPYDGSVRLLIDVQRFGFELLSFCVKSKGSAEATIELSVTVDATADPSLIRSRLARHPSVKSMNLVVGDDA